MPSPIHEFAATAELSVSFQRYPRPAAGWVGELPRSCGALPIILGPAGQLIVPCPAGEALWIGLIRLPATGTCDVRVVTAPGTEQLITVPPSFAVAGIPRGDGTSWALTRVNPVVGAPVCDHLALIVSTDEPTSLAVDLIDAAHYEALSGERLAPLDEADAYGGWRLP